MFSSFLLTVFIFVFLSPLLVSADVTCSGTANGAYYDLSPLKGKEFTGAAASGYAFQYAINLCSAASGSGKCTGKNAMMCQLDMLGNFNAIDAYSNDGQGKPSLKPIDPTNPKKGVIYTVEGDGNGCPAQYTPRRAIITINCDPTVTGTPAQFTVTENPTCQNTLTITHAVGCPTTPPPASGSGSGKLSGGSVFVIIFFVSALVYVVAGCTYKRVKLGTGGVMESCPNNDFWVSLPGLVKDGLKFFVAKCRSLCDKGGSGSTTSYESI